MYGRRRPLRSANSGHQWGLYGTTNSGGANCAETQACGTVFKIAASGALTTLYTFCAESGCPDGAGPWGLVQATTGDFYGTTNAGGASNYGTVCRITPSGTLTTLHSFCTQSGCADGVRPRTGLIQATNGDLYGTTFYGGANDDCNTGGPEGCGTVFQITPGARAHLRSVDPENNSIDLDGPPGTPPVSECNS